MKERKAGVAMGGWDWGPPGGAEPADWGLEMGSVGGDAIPSCCFVMVGYERRNGGERGRESREGQLVLLRVVVTGGSPRRPRNLIY